MNIYVVYIENKDPKSKKRPEKLPFSHEDIQNITTPKQLSLLGLKPEQIQDYINREVIKEPELETPKKFESPKIEEREEIFFSKKFFNESSIMKTKMEEKKEKKKGESRSDSNTNTQKNTFHIDRDLVFKTTALPTIKQEEKVNGIEILSSEIQKTLQECSLSSSSMLQYIENMRYWFHHKILKPLNSCINEINLVLKKKNLEAYDFYNPLDSPPDYHIIIPQNVPTPQTGKMTLRLILQYIYSQNQQSIELLNRLNLEEYLDIPGCNRKYLIERIQSLSEGGLISRFKWDSGGDYNGRTWNERDFPTDSQILFHLFCKFFDLLLPSHPYFGQTAFTQKHFLKTLTRATSGIYLNQKSKFPPHFNVVYASNVYETEPGRNNLFFTLVIFAHLINTKFEGYIDSVSIESVDLKKVVKN